MPPNGDFSEEERQLIETWITDMGAYLNDRKLMSEVDELKLIQNDLSNLSAETQRRVRYISLRQLYNGKIANEILDSIRIGLNKALNSLSRNPNVTKAISIDAEKILYRINLDSLNISNNRWESTIRDFYPFGKNFESDGSPLGQELASLHLSNSTQTGSQLYLLQGDWFVATALLPPVYERFLNLPSTLQQLEQSLNLSLRRNILDNKVMRSGFKDSGVSFNNRIIERHESDDGLFFWISYDFAQSQNEQSIFENPLGPRGIGFDNEAFIQDGGEIIFQLPNGFFGYYLLNNIGNSIDKGPLNVVKQIDAPDELLTTIVNGFSCGSCHGQGLLYKNDEIRQFAINSQRFSNQAKDKIMKLYTDPNVFKAKMDEDNLKYMLAMKEVGIDMGAPDPIRSAFNFYNRKLQLSDVAIHLETSLDNVKQILTRNPFRDDWAALIAGGSISREEFNRRVRQALSEDVKVRTFGPTRGDIIATPECMVEDPTFFTSCIGIGN